MKEQSFKSHARYVPLFHGSALFILLGIVGAVVNFIHAYNAASGRLIAALLLLLFLIAGLFFWFIRTFALGAQDRAIRAEENLRYFALTGKVFDTKLKLGQIIALRFAPNEEFVALTDRAVNENLTPVNIKQAIQNWRPDYYRI